MLVVSTSHKLTLAQEVDWPWANVLPDTIACCSARTHDLGGASSLEAKPGANAMADKQSSLQPRRMMTKDSKEDVDDGCAALRERDLIRVGEERHFDQFAVKSGVRRQGARNDDHVTPNVRGKGRHPSDPIALQP